MEVLLVRADVLNLIWLVTLATGIILSIITVILVIAWRIPEVLSELSGKAAQKQMKRLHKMYAAADTELTESPSGRTTRELSEMSRISNDTSMLFASKAGDAPDSNSVTPWDQDGMEEGVDFEYVKQSDIATSNARIIGSNDLRKILDNIDYDIVVDDSPIEERPTTVLDDSYGTTKKEDYVKQQEEPVKKSIRDANREERRKAKEASLTKESTVIGKHEIDEDETPTGAIEGEELAREIEKTPNVAAEVAVGVAEQLDDDEDEKPTGVVEGPAEPVQDEEDEKPTGIFEEPVKEIVEEPVKEVVDEPAAEDIEDEVPTGTIEEKELNDELKKTSIVELPDEEDEKPTGIIEKQDIKTYTPNKKQESDKQEAPIEKENQKVISKENTIVENVGDEPTATEVNQEEAQTGYLGDYADTSETISTQERYLDVTVTVIKEMSSLMEGNI